MKKIIGWVSKKTQYSFVIFALILLSTASCNKDHDLTEEQERIVEYFKDVAVGFEFCNGNAKITRKWGPSMRLFVDGTYDPELLTKIESVVEEINNLCTDGFEILFVNEFSQSNCHLFCGAPDEFVELYPETEDLLINNGGLFNVWWNASNRIIRARIFVETSELPLMFQQSIAMEELTQSLGLGRDSPFYTQSIFYETQNDGGFATEFAPIDRELIRLLYHPDMEVGLNESEVDILLRQILANE